MPNRFRALLTFLLVLTAPCPALCDQNPPPATSDSSQTAQPAVPPAAVPKKVWTNDDLHGGPGGVSVVGDRRSQNYRTSPPQAGDPATVARIRKNLEKLNAQLEETNRKVAQLKRFEAGENVEDGGRQMNKGLNRTPVDQQITQLEASQKRLQAQIGDLLDEARKKGIEPGQLR